MNLFLLTAMVFLGVCLQSHAVVLRSDFSGEAKLQRKAQSVNAFLHQPKFSSDHIAFAELRATYGHLSDEAFKAKLQSALARDLMFFRSFVNTYYKDLSGAMQSPNLILCLGDAHPENFGFLDFNEGTRFVFNDLDDSGVCPLEFDILRYFTSLRLAFSDPQIFSSIIKEYVEVFGGRKPALSVDDKLVPNLAKKREKMLRKYVDGAQFKSSEDYLMLPKETRQRMLKELAAQSFFSGHQILDIVEHQRLSGGSAGLERFYLLVRKDKTLHLLEMKESVRSGTEYGDWQRPAWTPAERLEKVKKHIWRGNIEHYSSLTFGGKNFLVRDRITSSPDQEDLSSEELLNLLRVQAGILATHHAQFVKGEIPELESWIAGNTNILTSRYRKTIEIVRSKK